MTTSGRPSSGLEPSTRSRISELLDSLAVREGVQASAVPGVLLARDSHASPRKPVMYEPMILFIGQGRKRAYIGEEVLRYDADNYLALSVPVPVECEVEASSAKPLLALKIAVEPALLTEIVLNLDTPQRAAVVPRGIDARPLTSALAEAVVRLLQCLRSPSDSRVLGPLIVREIIYRVLQDEDARGARSTLWAMAARSDRFMRIARVMQQIHADASRSLDTKYLAKRAGMSVSTFHHNFKAVTATSPLQYQKRIRLHRARLLMVNAGHSASTAAVAVGYESASQFGREFKRFFGASPAEEAAKLRARWMANAATHASAEA